MSTVTCPGGHASDAPDYCSVCGVKIDGAPVGSAPASTPDAAPASASCSNCGSDLEPDNRFCEVCGYDPSTGSLPEAPTPQPADPAPADATAASADADAAFAADAAAPPLPTPAAGTWVAVITADRDYYDRNDVTEVQFPLGVPARSIELAKGESQAIGRRSRSRGTAPAIDLAGPPEDAAVSHTHASLLPTDSGGWELVDHGSTNGTHLNESPHPIAANEPVPIAAGDRIYVGAWTKITLELQT